MVVGFRRVVVEAASECISVERQSGLAAASAVLRAGGLVVFPTESFYGLAVRADHPAAITRMARLKRRSGRKPIPMIAASRADVERVGRVPALLESVTQSFWPGPLTVAIPAHGFWPAELSAATGTLGVRISGHPVAHRLAELGGGLITASSANVAGAPPPIAPDFLDAPLAAHVDLIIDAGACPGGLPSTVVGVRGDGVAILRSGAIAVEDIARALGRDVEVLG